MDTPNHIQFAYRQGSRPVLLAKRRQWFGEGDTTTETTATDTNATVDKGKTDEKGLSQDKVNELVGNARKEGRSQAMADLLKELGLEKVDDLKTVVKSKKEADEARKTELEKAQERAETAEKKALEAEQLRLKVEQERLIDRRDSRITAALKDASNANRVLALMKTEKPELVEAVLKDGSVDEKALTALVTAAKSEFKEYFGTRGAGSPSNAGGYNPQGNEESDKAARAENLRRAKRDI